MRLSTGHQAGALENKQSTNNKTNLRHMMEELSIEEMASLSGGLTVLGGLGSGAGSGNPFSGVLGSGPKQQQLMGGGLGMGGINPF